MGEGDGDSGLGEVGRVLAESRVRRQRSEYRAWVQERRTKLLGLPPLWVAAVVWVAKKESTKKKK